MMKLLQYTQYLYLVFFAVFLYEAFSKYQAGESPWMILFLAAMSLFMFFFRRRFAQKMQQRNKTP
jgi:ABC-type transport system involved in cytochrome bd biosynthesis fused ATPase/permease subunit